MFVVVDEGFKTLGAAVGNTVGLTIGKLLNNIVV
jgi:hypothetical protein